MTRARELLEFSRSTVDAIEATVGHDDASGLTRKEQKAYQLLNGGRWRKVVIRQISDVGQVPIVGANLASST
jgi:hypothetical protein